MKLASLLTILTAFAMPVMAQAAFRFEDYKEKTAFKDAVNQNFPVGSSYLAFKKQVIGAGAKAGQDVMEFAPQNTYVFRKTEKSNVGSSFIHSWDIAVTVSGDTITAVSPTFARSGLQSW